MSNFKGYKVSCFDCRAEWIARRRRTCADGEMRCRKCVHRINSSNYSNSIKGKMKFKEYYNANKEKIVRRASDWCKENREQARVNEKKYRQTEKGKEVHRKKRYKRYWSDPDYYRKKAIARVHNIDPEFMNELEQKCQLCGTTDRLSVDHMHPISRGGTSDVSNLQILCISCNSFKGDRLFLPDGGMIVK